MLLRSFRIALLILMASLPFGPMALKLDAQFHETFSKSELTWKRGEADCVVPRKTWTQRRVEENSAAGTCEQINFVCGPGTKVLIAHDVTPAFVIPELLPSVRIKSTRPGVQLMARVVLPHTASPTGDGPLTTLLPGPRSELKNRWETLSFADSKADLSKLLTREAWVLRKNFGPSVNLKDAYIDKVVLNIFTSKGRSEVCIDDLKVNGIVDAVRVAGQSQEEIMVDSAVQQASFTQDSFSQGVGSSGSVEKRSSLVVRDGTVLEVKKKPYFPRVIQYNNESFEFLQSLGFNTIALKSIATDKQLQDAQRLDMWLVCPPPVSAGLQPIPFKYDRVLAWSLGDHLTGRDLQTFAQRAREVRQSDLREGRPIVANVDSRWVDYSHQADVLSIGFEPLGTSFIASQYSDWIRRRSEVIGDSKPIWANVQTEFSSALTRQISAISKPVPPTPIEPTQLKFLVFEALSAGSRGLTFLSKTPLDAPDPVTRLRALSVQWINDQVKQLEPWAVGGALMGRLDLNDNHLEVTAINTKRSRLLLVQRPTHHEQYWAGDTPMSTIRFQDTASTFTDRAYRITDDGLVPLPMTRNHGGAQIQIENCPYTVAIVLTQDPLVVNSLTSAYEPKAGLSRMQMHSDLTKQWLAIMQVVDDQLSRMGSSTSSASGALNEAINAFRKGESLVSAGSPLTSASFLNRAEERMAFARREMLALPLGQFQSKTSTPLLTHTSLIPLHWRLTQRMSEATWNPNGLAGGDFENLQLMLKNGWDNRRLDTEEVSTRVELAEDAAVGGKYGLKLTASSKVGRINLVESTPVWISTAKVPVKAGQMVRIHGWVNVPRVITGNHNGLMIIDSLGGRDLAERVPITRGWQEFTLYRCAEDAGEFDVTFELSGIGVAMVDEVTVRTIDLPKVVRSAKR